MALELGQFKLYELDFGKAMFTAEEFILILLKRASEVEIVLRKIFGKIGRAHV